MDELLNYLNASRARHSHLCPRQVLGVRIALAALTWLDLDPLAKRRKHLLVICETNGCFVDGIEVAAQVSIGHRTLRIEDYGKIAATFVDLRTARALRLHPAAGIRELAQEYFPLERRAYFAQLNGYQIIPDSELLSTEWVTLDRDVEAIMGSPRQWACCSGCGEEVINGREISQGDVTFCLACAGRAYYRSAMRAEIMEDAGSAGG